MYYRGFDARGDPLSPLYVIKLALHRKKEDGKEGVIGKLISRMPGYDTFFNVVIESEPIDLAVLSSDTLDKCDVVKRYTDAATVTAETAAEDGGSTAFQIMKQLYVPNVTLLDFVMKRGIFIDSAQLHNLRATNAAVNAAVPYSVPQFMNVLINTYEYLLVALARMQSELELVHYDLKVQNVVLNVYTKKPVIIDFGLAFSIRDVREVLQGGSGSSDLDTVLSLKSFFYGFHPDYSPWAIETHIISYIVQTTHEAFAFRGDDGASDGAETATATAMPAVATMDAAALSDLLDKFIASHHYLREQPEGVKRAFFDRAMRIYSKSAVGRPGLQVIRDYVAGDNWKKWELYSVATLCLDMIQEMNKAYSKTELEPYQTEIERFCTALKIAGNYIDE